MRIPSILGALLFATIILPAPASGQDAGHDTSVRMIVARGQALVSMRDVLAQVEAQEPGARASEFYLFWVMLGDRGSLNIYRSLPSPPGTISTDHHTYHAPIIGGVARRPERIANYDMPANGDGSPAGVVEGPTTFVWLTGIELAEIERAFENVRASHDSRLRLADLLVSYTSVRTANSRDTDSTCATIVFIGPDGAGRDYTVATRMREVQRTYQGMVAAGGC